MICNVTQSLPFVIAKSAFSGFIVSLTFQKCTSKFRLNFFVWNFQWSYNITNNPGENKNLHHNKRGKKI